MRPFRVLALFAATILVGALPLCACPGSRIAIVPTLDDAAWADANDPCFQMCARLAANACPVGTNPNCVPGCRVDQAQGSGAQIDVGCVLEAGTRSAIAACHVSCP